MAKNLCNLWLKICEICVLSFQPLTSTKDYVRNYKLFLQNKANFRKVKLNANDYIAVDYAKMDTWWSGKNEPKTNPNKANSNPNKPN